MLLTHLLTEDKSEFVVQQFGEKLLAAASEQEAAVPKKADALVKKLIKADPDNGKNLVWIARMYANKQFKLEDIARLKKEIETFNKVRKHLQVKDLNAYKNLTDLYAALEPHSDKPAEPTVSVKDRKAAEREAKRADADFLVDTPNFKALIPKSFNAARTYGAGTKWCTTGEHQYKRYSNDGDLIIVIAKIDGKDRKFQFHFESNSFMNELDQPANQHDLHALASSPEYLPFLEKLIDKYHG